MKVYNQDKTQILDNYDLDAGYLVEDIIEHTVSEVQEIKEQGHYEIAAEYPNGGKDFKWVVDTPGVPYQPARTETEVIKVYIPLPKEEPTKEEEYVETEEDKAFAEEYETFKRLQELTNDLVQAMAGAVFDNLEERKKEFREMHNKLRHFKGKTPREYKD